MEIIRFNTGGETIEYNNKMGSRNRHSRLLLYCRNYVWQFEGQDIPEVCGIIGTPEREKNGKWSNTTYRIKTAVGIKSSKIRQDFETGRFVNNHTSIPSIAKELGLYGVQQDAVVDYLQRHYPKCLERYNQHLKKMEEIERVAERENKNTFPYTYTMERINKRTGRVMLLIDGHVFNGEEGDKVKIVQKKRKRGPGGGSTTYHLVIVEGCEVEEIPEYSPYDPDDDSLYTRGYVYTEGAGWTKED